MSKIFLFILLACVYILLFKSFSLFCEESLDSFTKFYIYALHAHLIDIMGLVPDQSEYCNKVNIVIK